MHTLMSRMLFMVLLLALTGSAYAFEADGYTTPNSWSEHVSPGQFKQSYTGIGLTQDSKLYMTLTTRFRLKSDDYANDQDLYQYIRMNTDAVKLGNGTVKFSAFGRIADDIDGAQGKQWADKYYYSQRDMLDTEENGNSMTSRLYTGYAEFDNVIANTTANIGRFYLNHLNTFQLDGADATVKLGDSVSVYAFGGRPVSYFYDLDGDSLEGVGLSGNYMQKTKLDAEYIHLDVQDLTDNYSKIRLAQLFNGGSVVLGYTNLNSADTVNADADYEIASTGTILTAGYEGLLDNMDSDKTYVVNPLTYTLLDQSKYNKYKASVYQSFLDHFVAGIIYETRDVRGEENFDNRNYDRYTFKFDINGLPTEDTYISLSADKWSIDATGDTKSNDRMQYSAQVSQKINSQVDMWLGTSFNRYEYDYLTDKRKDSVRSYYVGGQYQPNTRMSFMLDLSREDTDFYDDVDSDLKTSYVGELWASLMF